VLEFAGIVLRDVPAPRRADSTFPESYMLLLLRPKTPSLLYIVRHYCTISRLSGLQAHKRIHAQASKFTVKPHHARLVGDGSLRVTAVTVGCVSRRC